MKTSRDQFKYWLSEAVRADRVALEALAQAANRLSLQNFGYAIGLYTPLYLSNYCENHCVYCGFHAGAKIKRSHLSLEAAALELTAIYQTGIREVLLLTGEMPQLASPSYIGAIASMARSKGFRSVGIEVYPMSVADYTALAEQGVNSLSLYQETYNREIYQNLHLSGPKRNYDWRYEGPGRAAASGISQINLGVLLGLGDYEAELLALFDHLSQLMGAYPEVAWGISLPRLQAATNWGHAQGLGVSDRKFVQALVALRLAFPSVSLAISSRETNKMRKNLIPLGINKLSAGARTTVGGYWDSSSGMDMAKQFPTKDFNGVGQICEMIKAGGYQPVLSDWL